ncbi:MAG: hypothetical protein HQK76_18790 [Desulfobacterales bacterium]|nr:hypothetical protein [Desulfobacterales bacterium]
MKLEEIQNKGVFFYHDDNFILGYLSCCLAEGLYELGIPIHCNKNLNVSQYTNFIFKRTNISMHDAAVFIIDLSNFQTGGEMTRPSNLPKNTVAVTISDNATFLRSEIPILIPHQNKFYVDRKSKNIPWAFGMTNKIINEGGKEFFNFNEREKIILRNFRATNNQSIRMAGDLAFIPYLEKFFKIDSHVEDMRFRDFHLFGDSHFLRLKKYIGCAAYGGMFFEPFFSNVDNYFGTFLKTPVIFRWDSWRFWESLACGCLTFALDFEKYGFILPVLPENFKHYIGLNFENPKECFDRLEAEWENIPKIAEEGRKWAIANYSPKASAQRFLKIIMNIF